MKRFCVLIIFLLTTVRLLAQTQYDYYEGRDAYGGVDAAISGLKILGIIVLVIVAIVIVGGIWAKTMDLFKPPKETEPHNKPTTAVDMPQIIPSKKQAIAEEREPERDVVITIAGKTIEVDVTLNDGSKKPELFWYEINGIYYDFTKEITFDRGDDIVNPAGSAHGECCVRKEDVKNETITIYKCYNSLKIRGEFNPRKLHFVRIDGLGIYDKSIFYYDGEVQRQKMISEKIAIAI